MRLDDCTLFAGAWRLDSTVGTMMRTRRLHTRLAYVMRVDDRASVVYAAASARSRRCAGLCIVVVAVHVAAADAVLVAHQVHPATIAGNPKARGKMTACLPRAV